MKLFRISISKLINLAIFIGLVFFTIEAAAAYPRLASPRKLLQYGYPGQEYNPPGYVYQGGGYRAPSGGYETPVGGYGYYPPP